MSRKKILLTPTKLIFYSKFCPYTMALPFLPPNSILPTYHQIDAQELDLQDMEFAKVQKMKHYIKRQWIDKLPSEELSIWDQEMATNN